VEPSAHLQNEVARRLGDLGVSDADRKAYGIASAAIRMAVPEALEQVARAHRAAEFAVRRSDAELASLPSLRYALALYADGLADGGRLARQTLRTPAVERRADPPPDASVPRGPGPEVRALRGVGDGPSRSGRRRG
jgi:hypothetical protein